MIERYKGSWQELDLTQARDVLNKFIGLTTEDVIRMVNRRPIGRLAIRVESAKGIRTTISRRLPNNPLPIETFMIIHALEPQADERRGVVNPPFREILVAFQHFEDRSPQGPRRACRIVYKPAPKTNLRRFNASDFGVSPHLGKAEGLNQDVISRINMAPVTISPDQATIGVQIGSNTIQIPHTITYETGGIYQ